jgi:hypothetical protein
MSQSRQAVGMTVFFLPLDLQDSKRLLAEPMMAPVDPRVSGNYEAVSCPSPGDSRNRSRMRRRNRSRSSGVISFG